MSLNRRNRMLSTLLVALSALTLTTVALADPKQEARGHYDRALELVDDGQYAEAIVEFNRCYELKPHYAVLYNLAQAYIALAKPVDAVDTLQRYLSEGGRAIRTDRRKAVEREIARQTARIATLELRIVPPGSTIQIDGRDYGKAPMTAPIRLGQGSHNLSVTCEGFASLDASVDLAGQDHRTLEVTLKAAQNPQPGPVEYPAAAPSNQRTTQTLPGAPVIHPSQPLGSSSGQKDSGTGHRKNTQTYRILGAVSTGAGVVGVLAGTTAWLVARSKHHDAVNVANNGSRSSAESMQRDAERIMVFGNIGLIGGGVLAASGIVVLLAAPRDSSNKTAAAHALRIAPSIDREFIGMAASTVW